MQWTFRVWLLEVEKIQVKIGRFFIFIFGK
jgi:hypothetical protein